MGRLDREKVEVEVCDFEPFENKEYKGFKLIWGGNIGFGEYTIYQKIAEPEIWYGESECMDSDDDKWFIKLLLKDIVERLKITE